MILLEASSPFDDFIGYSFWKNHCSDDRLDQESSADDDIIGKMILLIVHTFSCSESSLVDDYDM